MSIDKLCARAELNLLCKYYNTLSALGLPLPSHNDRMLVVWQIARRFYA